MQVVVNGVELSWQSACVALGSVSTLHKTEHGGTMLAIPRHSEAGGSQVQGKDGSALILIASAFSC